MSGCAAVAAGCTRPISGCNRLRVITRRRPPETPQNPAHRARAIAPKEAAPWVRPIGCGSPYARGIAGSARGSVSLGKWCEAKATPPLCNMEWSGCSHSSAVHMAKWGGNRTQHRQTLGYRNRDSFQDDAWDLTPRWSRDLEEVQPQRRRAVARSKPPAAPVTPPPRRPMRARLVRLLRRLLQLIEGKP